MALEQQTVPNLIQGVSQQAAQVRRPTQCDSQFDCLNQVVEGCVPRPGLETSFVPGSEDMTTLDLTGAWFHDIIRSTTERYTAVIKDGELRVWNFLTGVECTVTVEESADAYLVIPGGELDRDAFAATSADDVTFIANRSLAPLMAPIPDDPFDSDDPLYGNMSPPRNEEALFYFKAGAYKATYTIRVFIATMADPDGVWFEWTYETPDNSIEANASYIQTDAICYALYNAMVTDSTNPIASGLGFNIERNGNLIHLWREDDVPFAIETADGLSNTQLIGLKSFVPGFDKLPINGFPGMVFRVQGDKTADEDDYYVQFNPNDDIGESTTSGVWEESPAAAIPIKLDRTTMPVQLVNTSLNAFTLKYGTWGDRIAGDGEDSAKDPTFVGRFIERMAFDQRRLAIETRASCVWSRVNNVFTFFPDTVQANLATAPIDIEVKSGKRVPILHDFLQAGAQTFIWAEGMQFLVSHGDTSTFSGETIEVNPSTAYEWDNLNSPLSLGASVIFANEVGQWSQFTDATFQDGRSLGDTGISDHVPKYIPLGTREVIGSDTLKKFMCWGDTVPNAIYLYEYRFGQPGERLQSAWNIWRLPDGCTILHTLLDRSRLYVWVQRDDCVLCLTCSLQPSQEDPEGQYLTRMDMRLTEADCTVVYDAITDTTTVTLPRSYADTMAHLLDPDGGNVIFACRTTTGTGEETRNRGLVLVPTSDSDDPDYVFTGDITGVTFYVGFRVRGERTENIFYVHDDQAGYSYKKRLDVKAVVISHAGSGYFRAEILRLSGAVIRYQQYEGKAFGDPASVYDQVILGTGDYEVSIGLPNVEHRLRLVNDSHLPCSWQGLNWSYTSLVQAVPGR